MTQIETYIDVDSLNERTAFDYVLAADLLTILENSYNSNKESLLVFASEFDFVSMSVMLHKIKGSIGIFGFDNLLLFLQKIEDNANCKNRKFDYLRNINLLFESLSVHIVELKKILKDNGIVF